MHAGKIVALGLALTGCASPTLGAIGDRMVLYRDLSGPTSAQVEAISLLAKQSGLCPAEMLPGLLIETAPVGEFVGKSCLADPTKKVDGYYEPYHIHLAGKADKPCGALVHELAHHCRGDPEHVDRALWDLVERLRTTVFESVCP